MNIVIFGPPGAGKGTQADFLVSEFKLLKVSTGDLLRKEIEKESDLGLEIKDIIDKGQLASDNIINSLIEKLISNNEYANKLIFDGYPRNLSQAKNLDLLTKKYNQKISCVLNLSVDKETIIKRISGRQICTNCGLIFNRYFKPTSNINHTCDPKFLIIRSDDNQNTIINRYETYLKETLPILNFYRKQNLLHQINGMKKIDQIYEEIQGIITSLEA